MCFFLRDSFLLVPGYVSDVHLQIYGRSVHINWNPPLNPNGYIESYEIRWIETRNEGDTRPAKEERLTMDRRSREAYLINKMTPLTYFDVTIRARNRLGPGRPWVRERFAVSAEDSKLSFCFDALCCVRDGLQPI